MIVDRNNSGSIGKKNSDFEIQAVKSKYLFSGSNEKKNLEDFRIF